MMCEVKHNWDMGVGHVEMGYLWLSGQSIYDLTSWAFMT